MGRLPEPNTARKYIFTLFVLVSIALTVPNYSHAAISDWQKGFTLHLNNQANSDVDKALEGIKNTGADYVTFSPGWLTDNKYSTNVYRKAGTTTDEKLVYAIRKAKSLGMKVMLKPHLDRKDGGWRAFIDPTDKAKFFQNYSAMILGYANIAKAENVEQLAIGAELHKLSTNPDNKKYWDALIANVRSRYSGKLTYSANSDPVDFDEHKLTFWGGLDYWGASMYIGLGSSTTPTKASLLSEWQKIETNYILPHYNANGQKPLVITEIGYRSVDGAAKDPELYSSSPPVDLAEQQLLYESFFEFWKDKPYMKGVHFWEWDIGSTAGGTSNKDYTPQGKPAEQTVKNYFKSAGTTTTPTPAPVPEPTPAPVPTPAPEETPPTVRYINNINKSSYSTGEFKVGSNFFNDRDYTVTELPSFLDSGEHIKTLNADKNQTGSSFLSFELVKQVDLYVAYDSRATSLPSWLSGWENTGYNIKSTDAVFKLYRKTAATGNITLGGNLASGASGALSNYFVIATEKPYVPLATPPTTTPTSPDPSTETPPVVAPDTEPDPTEESEPSDDVTGQIEISDPKEGQYISGEKKLKFFIDGVDPEDYKGYYDISGDGLGDFEMSNADKYKQAKVNYDSWNWLGTGPYKITFTAKDSAGNIIDTASVNVYIKL